LKAFIDPRKETTAAMKIFLATILLSSPWTQYEAGAFSLGTAMTARRSGDGSSMLSYPLVARLGSFLPRKIQRSAAASRPSTRLSMVFDKMSDDCIAAVKASHDLGNELGLEVLRTEVLFAGVIAKPERAVRTLQKYKIEADQVKEAVIRTLTYKSDVNMKGPNPTKDPLPFSEESRAILTKAQSIAERMESQTIRSEHVLLALMGYNGGKPIKEVPVLEVLGDIPSLKQSKENFSVTSFCEDLVNVLPMTPYDDLGVQDRVVIGGRSGSGNTNTLSEVGVDLTQLALEGKLDLVFGRDQEIRSALRTLGRRRKNNPCLIGDPGTMDQQDGTSHLVRATNATLTLCFFFSVRRRKDCSGRRDRAGAC
jgi:Clp amino terminal domain, pathogenicity island component